MTEHRQTRKKTASKDAKPWDQDNPKAEGHHHALSPQAKASARRHAQAAGRPYPNLVDNMHAAAEDRKKEHPAKGKAKVKSGKG